MSEGLFGDLFPPFDPENETGARHRFRRRIPVRKLFPNVITLLALAIGLSAIRLGIEGRYEWAVAAIVIAAALDSIDGRVARMLKSTSRFGAELDSLADFVNFGVAPAILIYMWALSDLGSAGWLGVLAFAICICLRLARFNAAIEAPAPSWRANYFVGCPAPASALCLLLPIYLYELGLTEVRAWPVVILIYAAGVSLLTISRIPTFSGKMVGRHVPRHLVLPMFLVAVLYVASLISFPWLTLSVSTLAYLAVIPIGVRRYRHMARKFHARDRGRNAGALAADTKNTGQPAEGGSTGDDLAS